MLYLIISYREKVDQILYLSVYTYIYIYICAYVYVRILKLCCLYLLLGKVKSLLLVFTN